MKSNRLMRWIGIALFIIIILSGCTIGKRSETIIIPSKHENITIEQESHSFQVETIYRLPKPVYLLGWKDSGSVVGIFQEKGASENITNEIQQMKFPYEEVESLQKIDNNMVDLILSPNGKKVAQVSTQATAKLLKLISLDKSEEIKITSGEEIFLQDITWSNNSQYLCFLTISPLQKNQAQIGVYDTISKSSQTYNLENFDERGTLIGLSISDDGKSLVLSLLQNSNSSIAIVTILNNQVQIQYERQTGSSQSAWLNNNQVVFLGTDQTLYEYDLRNDEVSILLEKVDNFEFSRNRKKIAYSIIDQDSTFAGALQGKNILYQEPIYHGLSVSEMKWSPDDKKLLLSGRKTYTPKQSSLLEEEAVIIDFK
ncbi:hypothetical protein CHH62_09270 [Niallia circulans]|uniref:hypothetical protein n=1 Tax=Niallia circulans TaxID=1397 RepID=UPI000BA5515C|nr:hypothetical protein [Niallia circulans]PAD26035.1 hypothetical protein CHH62_09270 [Niallia circulans]